MIIDSEYIEMKSAQSAFGSELAHNGVGIFLTKGCAAAFRQAKPMCRLP
jgi:hypothetical protein